MNVFKGSKGGGGSFKQKPDNLRSNDTFEGVLGVGIGPMRGPTNGLKSIKVDGTAVENATGELNLSDFIVNIGDGDPLKFPQTIELKLGAGAAPTQVGLTLTNPLGNNPTWVTKTLNNQGANFIDLRFIVNQLFRQDKKGIYEATANLEIQMKPVGKTNWISPNIGNPGGTYSPSGVASAVIKVLIPRSYYDAQGNWKTDSGSFKITGKTTSPAVYELRLSVPNEGPYANTAWDVRVRLLERETYQGGTDGVDQEKRTITWESMAAVYSGNLGTHEDWRGVAWMQIYGKASDQLTGVPEITGEWDTKIISVPPSSLYDPITRTYTAGTWDGSYAKSFCTDPAWIVNDAISDSLSGLSLVAPGSYLNKWDALEASKWFSERVPDGNGGTEPRYSLNLAISQPQKAEEFIRYLAGAVGALAWDQGNGEWRLKCDKPDIPVDLFTLDNIEGEFVYSHTDVDTRYNDITFAFKNKEMDYREDRVRLYNNASIALIGRKPTTIVGVGCTGRQEAMRRGKLRIESTVGETKIVNFTTNRRGRNIDHLDLILVADGDLGARDRQTNGRCVAISADRKTITLRDTVYLAQGLSYNLRFTSPNVSYAPTASTQPPDQWKKPTLASTRAVVNLNSERGPVTVIKLDAALPADIDLNLAVALESATMPPTPKLYRVTNVVVGDDGERISISALEVNIAKWANSDNVSKEDTVFQDLRGAVPVPLAPDNGVFLSLARVPVEQGFQTNLVVNFKRPPGAFISGFQIVYSINGGAKKVAIENLQQATYEFVNPSAGRWDVEVRTMDRRGGLSRPLTGALEISQDQLSATDIKYADQTTIEYLKPAEPGATRGIGDSTIGGMTQDQVVQGITFNADSIAKNYLTASGYQALLDAQTFYQGQPLGTLYFTEKSERIQGQNAITSNMELLGSRSPDGNSWLLNMDAVKSGLDDAGNPISIGTKLQQVGVKMGEIEAQANFLMEATVTPAGALGKAVLRVTADGAIAGFSLTAKDGIGDAAFLVNSFRIVDPNGGQPFTPFIYEGGVVKMLNVEIDKLSVGSVTSAAILPGAVRKQLYWIASTLGAGPDMAPSSEWGIFGPTDNKARKTVSSVPEGAEVSIRMYINGQRTGSNNDRIRFRMKRISPTFQWSYLETISLGLTDTPAMLTYEWNDLNITQAGTYTYELEAQRTSGDGAYLSGKLIIDTGKR